MDLLAGHPLECACRVGQGSADEQSEGGFAVLEQLGDNCRGKIGSIVVIVDCCCCWWCC